MPAKTLRNSLNKAFLKVKPNRSQIDDFKKNLKLLLENASEGESEEHHKNLVADFLKNTYYSPDYFINTKGTKDQVIHTGKTAKTPVGVIIEAKSPSNKAEMPTKSKLNTKAVQELVLYFLRERITDGNKEVKHLIVTNLYEWFIFDSQQFERHFAQNKKLVKQFEEFEAKGLSGTKTDFFYKEIASPVIEEVQDSIEFTQFSLKNYLKPLKNEDPKDDDKLIVLYKAFSPEHLLKLPFANDSNSLNRSFYSELLHLIGLTEEKQKGKKIIQRLPEEKRNPASLLENAINQLEALDFISRLENPKQYGATAEERYFNVGLELVITWINRVLFMKLLEAQLLSYHKGDKNYSFLNSDQLHDYDDLNTLFFQVLAKRLSERSGETAGKFDQVPYLNSSLFDPTEIEYNTIRISSLQNELELPLLPSTVLKDRKGKRETGKRNTLQYLFDFLNAYDFSSEGGEKIQEENKTLINASVLGLIFEKINGYKDGSFFTPGFITTYMSRESIRRAVLQKFNEAKGWDCKDFTDLHNHLGNSKEERNDANDIINSLKICDPAVGSGHFLVSALNEMIAIKGELRLLQDKEGKTLRSYDISIVNDELIITDENEEFFEYQHGSKESQRVQETLFHEKQTIIENCLFGVDINPNSVKICRLRLWVELLKSAYYRADTKELETLPNIDINIKCGNSLISRFALDADLKKALKKSKWGLESYRSAVLTYQHAESKEQKREMEKLIGDIKSDFRSEINANSKEVKQLYKTEGEVTKMLTQQQMFEMSSKEKAAFNQEMKKLSGEAEKLRVRIEEIKNNTIYENAFEWRFEFPEVLDDKGEFIGFDVILGNPPYIPLESFSKSERSFFKNKFSQLERKYETSVIFMLQGFELLKDHGGLAYIAPLTWETGENYSKFREHLFSHNSIDFLINLPFDIFEDAYVETGIFQFSKSKSDQYKIFTFKKADKIENLQGIPFQTVSYALVDREKYKIVLNPFVQNILHRIPEAEIAKLGDITISTQGLSGSRFKEVDEESSEEDVYPFMTQGNVYNYELRVEDSYDTSLSDMPSLQRFYEAQPKLLIRRIVNRQNRLSVGYTDKRLVFKKDINPFIPTDNEFEPKYILAVMASRLISFLYLNLSSIASKDDFRQTTLTELRDIPIFRLSQTEQQRFVSLADKVLSQKQSNREADTLALEAEIDRLVYELYGLSEEEVEIINSST